MQSDLGSMMESSAVDCLVGCAAAAGSSSFHFPCSACELLAFNGLLFQREYSLNYSRQLRKEVCVFHKLLIKHQVGGLSATQPLRSLSYRRFLQQDLFLAFLFASRGRILIFLWRF